MSSTPDLLGIPFELREIIYTYLLPVPSNDCFWAYPRPPQTGTCHERSSNYDCPCNVWRNMALSCLQLWHEIGGFLSPYAGTVDIYPLTNREFLASMFRCLCGFSFFRPRFTVIIKIERQICHGSPRYYSNLLAVCRFLARKPSLPHVEVRLASGSSDPGSYWTTSPAGEEVALIMIAFLTPFRLLARNPVQSSHLSIIGRTVSLLWEHYPDLAGFANRICQEIEGKEVPAPLSLELVPTLQFKLTEATRNNRSGPLFCFLGLYSTRVRSGGRGIDTVRTVQRPELLCSTCGIELWYRDSMSRHLDLFHGGGRPTVTDGENGGKMVLRKPGERT